MEGEEHIQLERKMDVQLRHERTVKSTYTTCFTHQYLHYLPVPSDCILRHQRLQHHDSSSELTPALAVYDQQKCSIDKHHNMNTWPIHSVGLASSPGSPPHTCNYCER